MEVVMKLNKKFFLIMGCFAIINVHADDEDILKQSRLISVTITAQVISPAAALMMLGEHAIKSPFELILDLINNHFNDFIFTIDNTTYIVQSNFNPHEPVVDTPSENCITTNIFAYIVSPLQATAILAQASALFFAKNLFQNPIDFIEFIFQQSPEGFVFTIDNMTYIIRS